MPEADADLLDLVKQLVPTDTDPEKVLIAVEKLARFKGEIVQKAVVRDVVAEALGLFVDQIDWPCGWRRIDW
jgi:hypothetical protein